MSRRHFMKHVAGASALAVPALNFASTLQAHAADLQKNQKAVILLWMGGGPATIDIWDLKPGSVNGGPFRPIATSGDMQITEHMPLMAQQMHHMSIVRSMSTREADHNRGRYYMHTGYVPNPNVQHPSYGAVVAHELEPTRPQLEIPPFVSVGGSSAGPGFLGMAYAPFVVNSNGQVKDLQMDIDPERVRDRVKLLNQLEASFIRQNRGSAPQEHAKVLQKTQRLMSSKQMDAFKVNQESAEVREQYGNTNFGRGCLMARRLVETGVPFVEVNLGGWDTHSDNFDRLQTKLPEMDRAMAALVSDLDQRGMLDNVAIVWMGEFGRTPRINGNTGRDHWARSWSVVVGGAGFQRGIAVGQTNADGTAVDTEPYTSEDLMASVLHGIGISLDTRFTATNGRPMKIANGGRLIKELFA
ncbi:MAG: DUF1501 domain-containing protein [Planctomycetales bacterium]|nr:DUF1501 domain-containing protein [Planctomycetales bacterium]NIM08582.1 DUF1501 domain-containing protein [Planctomycetales bacterium]NIN08051.1 DUF1501 domain-containing protein [Planctomycetales bacterium]NIN77187.1 DUF1501 domain-containing protein [Planctomycetales bacterium]NIO34369.1 DUF1501 domain-containing protein [Planctomycetales bacterium]